MTETHSATIRDRLWLWGHPAGAHDTHWNTPRPSRMTPAEACYYMGIPNLLMVQYNSEPAPPLDQWALALAPLKRVVWSIVGEGGRTNTALRDAVLQTCATSPNVVGVIMDDFFRLATAAGPLAALSVEDLQSICARLAHGAYPGGRSGGGGKLDLWVVLYDHQLDMPVREHLAQVDVITLWTWEAKNLAQLERDFAKARDLAPHAQFMLGCYMWDYGAKPGKPIPLDVMQMQCETGLRWLQQGQIDGMIFLASCICDLQLEAVEWTRRWIERVCPA